VVLSPAGLQPVLVHLSKNDKGKFSFNPLSVNLMTEVFKVVFALVVLLILVSITCSHSTDSSSSSGSSGSRQRKSNTGLALVRSAAAAAAAATRRATRAADVQDTCRQGLKQSRWLTAQPLR
jgi:hypothetical protein